MLNAVEVAESMGFNIESGKLSKTQGSSRFVLETMEEVSVRSSMSDMLFDSSRCNINSSGKMSGGIWKARCLKKGGRFVFLVFLADDAT